MPTDRLTLDDTALSKPDKATLKEQTYERWWQVNLQFTDWGAAEHVASSHLMPLLNSAAADGAATKWWFIRKHPCWRLRIRPHDHGLQDRIGSGLDELTASGHLHRWWTGIYEPEAAAFGNADSMRIAHELFHVDSRAILDLNLYKELPLGRRELSIMLCGTLLRAAALEWYEQGDVWHRVAQERPLPDDVRPDQLQELANALQHLMLADTTPDGPLLGNDRPLSFAADWAGAFREAGASLGTAARTGTVDRGLRHILSYHVIFHWNRLGLPARKQSILAWAARAAILGPLVRKTNTRSSGLLPPAVRDLAARFPLVPRARLTCPDLETRITKARAYAQESEGRTDPLGRLERACSAWNLAALIVADCGMPGFAADLSWRQFQVLQKAWPVAGPIAIASLQPLVNLARLTGRAGNPDNAYQVLHSMNHAVQHGAGSAQIHGRSVSFDAFTTTSTDRHKVVPWLRNVLLEDGTRLLVATNQWTRAAAHATAFDKTRERLGDARQVQFIAHLNDGHADAAFALLDSDVNAEPWEQAAAACLRAFADLRIDRLNAEGVAMMLETVRDAMHSLPGRAETFFRFRLGLTAVDLATQACPGQEEGLCTELIRDATESGDALAAKEVLRHHAVRRRMTTAQNQLLNMLVHNAGLGHGSIPPSLFGELIEAVHVAETCLTQALGISPSPAGLSASPRSRTPGTAPEGLPASRSLLHGQT
ncbi:MULTISPECIES: thiopeptide-type bacteriocin biosynthesis protein [unclassified Streptomyces]|uniref:thiopeptide-type bacteriocin biosynthesis protein n=1 Tax=unclassified Streptomyces TaxID=2593676 RepID=UPI00345081D1